MPSNCGGRHFCPGCGEELIHRDHRKPWESASAFGQIVWRMGPEKLTTGDIDHYSALFERGGPTLFRVIEHKQPDQSLKGMQSKALATLAALIEHCISCEEFPDRLDERSGLFLIRGTVTAEANGYRRTYFDGPMSVARCESGTFVRKGMLPDAEALFRWLEGTQGTPKPSGPRRKKQLPLPFDGEFHPPKTA